MKLETFVGTTCPYCHLVRKFEKQGRTDVEICNINLSAENQKRLVGVGGKDGSLPLYRAAAV